MLHSHSSVGYFGEKLNLYDDKKKFSVVYKFIDCAQGS